MKKFVSVAFATTAALALSACGSSEDASVEAEAENVELPAEEAVAEVEEMPVEDTIGTSETDTTQRSVQDTVAAGEAARASVEEEADDAGAAAAAAAADVRAIARDAGTRTENAIRREGNAAVDRAADAARREIDN